MCTVKKLTVVDFLRLIDATNTFHHAKLSGNLSKKQMEQFSRFFSFIGERRSFHFSPFAFTRRKALDNDKFEIPKRFSLFQAFR